MQQQQKNSQKMMNIFHRETLSRRDYHEVQRGKQCKTC